MGMSQSYGVPDDTESIATIHRALELGLVFSTLPRSMARSSMKSSSDER